MGKTRLPAEERRVGIVEAAKPLFARHGFAGTTTRQIAQAAGVSEALVFQHFPSKAALYREILHMGCEGDPGLERLGELGPSTASLCEMVGLLIRHVAMGALCDAREKEVDDRLTLHSLLEDGEYERLVSEWVVERIQPTFTASFEAAGRAGDLRPATGAAANAFWFAHHAAAMTAFGRLSGRDAYPYRGGAAEVMADLARFILRGIGLTDEAIATNFDAAALRQANVSAAAA
jgi:TetR/AcrR family transcriptional regulator, transcriptional repressor of aconitase